MASDRSVPPASPIKSPVAVTTTLTQGALIHADYPGQGGVVVEKFRDAFEFSNPGTLLVSFDQLLRGNVSECRNKALQTIFMLIGAAEKAGSGVDKMRKGWASQHWRSPVVRETARAPYISRVTSYMTRSC